MSKDQQEYRHPAYDDSFRTVETECDDALLRFVNYVFQTDYDRTAKVTHLRNEQFVESKGKITEKRITDARFEVDYRGEKTRYHFECESEGYSSTIMVRLFQYAAKIGLADSVKTHGKLVIKMPKSGLLVLRDKGNPPEKVLLEIETPGGNVLYDIPVICVANYTIEEMFEKKLYFLVPYIFFNYEEQMGRFETDIKALKEFEELYVDVLERLRMVEESDLSLRSKGVIIKQMESVTRRLAANKENIRKKVGDIMGGQVIKMEWLERFDAAMAGSREEGEENRLIRQVCRKLRKGKDVEQIADELEEDEIRIKAICDVAEAFFPYYDEEKVIAAIRQNALV